MEVLMIKRNQLIDSLRGFSMIVIIFTHATAFFPSDRFVSTLWNWSNFAVPIFIFCSVYLFLQKNSGQSLQFLTYLKKRFFRLLLPYYIFLPFFLLILFFVSSEAITFKYLWQSVLVIGGVDINWLVLLFIYITLILPFFVWSRKKSPLLFWTFFVISLSSAVYLLFNKIDLPYKFIMWLPWSLMLYFTWFYSKFEHNKKIILGVFVVSCLIFGLSFSVLSTMQQSTILVHNKYPPNLLYLSYGVAVLLGLILIEKYIFAQKMLLKIVNFFSRYSYSIYFLHYLLLTLFAAFIGELGLNWWSLFLLVLFSTVILQKLYIWAKQSRLLY
jgi:peptidoglycan/LPS O-acetylase OafA/YrhL